MIKPELRRLSWRNPLHWLATGFGSGLSPWAPGTMGTLIAIPLYLLLPVMFDLPDYQSLLQQRQILFLPHQLWLLLYSH